MPTVTQLRPTVRRYRPVGRTFDVDTPPLTTEPPYQLQLSWPVESLQHLAELIGRWSWLLFRVKDELSGPSLIIEDNGLSAHRQHVSQEGAMESVNYVLYAQLQGSRQLQPFDGHRLHLLLPVQDLRVVKSYRPIELVDGTMHYTTPPDERETLVYPCLTTDLAMGYHVMRELMHVKVDERFEHEEEVIVHPGGCSAHKDVCSSKWTRVWCELQFRLPGKVWVTAEHPSARAFVASLPPG